MIEVIAIVAAIAAGVALVVWSFASPVEARWAKRASGAFRDRLGDTSHAVADSKAALAELRVGIIDLGGEAEQLPKSKPILDACIRDVTAELDRAEAELAALDGRPAEMRVSLFGRTKAGKSTLWAAISGQPAELSAGRQNTTQEIRPWTKNGVCLIDQPGVAGAGRPDLERLAWEGTTDADLVLFVLTEDKIVEVDQEHMRRLADLSIPVACLINVKQSEVSERAFLEDPRLVFEPQVLDEYRSSVADLFRRAGHRDPEVVVLHADFAHKARFPRRRKWRAIERRRLWKESRVDEALRLIETHAGGAAEYRGDAVYDVVLARYTRIDRLLFTYLRQLEELHQDLATTLPAIRAILEETQADTRARSSRIGELLAAAQSRAIEVAVRAHERSSARELENYLLEALDLDGVRRALEMELEEAWHIACSKIEELEGDRKLVAQLGRRLDVEETWSRIRKAARRERFAQAVASAADVVAGALVMLSYIVGTAGRAGAVVSKALGSLARRQKKKAAERHEEAIRQLREELGDYMSALRTDFLESWDQAADALIIDLDAAVIQPLIARMSDVQTALARITAARATAGRVVMPVAVRRFDCPSGLIVPISPRAALVESYVRKLRRATPLHANGIELVDLLSDREGLLVSQEGIPRSSRASENGRRRRMSANGASELRTAIEEAHRLVSLVAAKKGSNG